MTRLCLHRSLLIGALLAYLALALPLPFVLLDHELGIFTGDPTHSMIDDHAWLDHAAGDGMTSDDVIPDTLNPCILIVSPFETLHRSFDRTVPSVRGPPILLS